MSSSRGPTSTFTFMRFFGGSGGSSNRCWSRSCTGTARWPIKGCEGRGLKSVLSKGWRLFVENISDSEGRVFHSFTALDGTSAVVDANGGGNTYVNAFLRKPRNKYVHSENLAHGARDSEHSPAQVALLASCVRHPAIWHPARAIARPRERRAVSTSLWWFESDGEQMETLRER